MAGHELGAQIQPLASGDPVAVVDEVVVALILHQLVGKLLHIIDVQIAIVNTVLCVRINRFGGLRGLGRFGRLGGLRGLGGFGGFGLLRNDGRIILLDDHLALCIELKVAGLQSRAVIVGMTGHELGAQIQPLASGDPVAVVDEVVVALILHQLVGKLLHIIDVQEIADHAVPCIGIRGAGGVILHNNHLAVRAELVVTGLQRGAVIVGMTRHKLVTQVQPDILCKQMAVIDEIEITVALDQSVGVLHHAVLVEMILVGTGIQGAHTVFIGDVNGGNTGREGGADADEHIALAVEQIGLAVDLIGTAGGGMGGGITVIAGAVPVAGTRGGFHPGAVQQTAVVKGERDASVGNLLTVRAGKGGRVEVVPHAVNIEPAAGQPAAHGIVILAADVLQAGGIGSGSAGADQLAAGYLIDVAGGGNGGAPFDDGIAALAEGSAGIAGLGAGGSPVRNGFGGMDMGGAMLGKVGLIHVGHAGVHLGVHMELLIGEHIQHVALIALHVGDGAHVNVHLHVLGPEGVGSPVGLGGIAGGLDVGIEVDDPDRQTGQHGLAGLGIVAGAGDGDGGSVRLLRDGVLGGEAVGQLHVVELPVVDVVQVDHRGHGLDRLNGGGLQVHPVDGAEGDPVQTGIGGDHPDGGSLHTGLDLEHADDNGLVAGIVTDLKLDPVIAVGNGDVPGGQHAVIQLGSDLHAVNIYPGGGGIQAGGIVQGDLVLVCVGSGGLVRHGRAEAHHIAGGGNHIPLDEVRLAVEGDLADDGILTVLHSLGIIHGEVVQIVGVAAVDGAVLLPQLVVDGLVEHQSQEELALLTGHAVGGILIVLLIGLQRHFLEGTDVHGQVMPAGLVDVVVDVLGLHHADHIVGIENAVAVGVGLIVALDPALDVVLRDIQPEAHTAGVLQNQCLAVHAQTDPGVLLGVGILGGQAVGLQAHGVFAVMDLAVGPVGQGQLQLIIPVGGVLTVVDDIPLIDVSLAALKVPKDLGSSAQVELNSGGGVGAHVQGGGDGAGQIGRGILLIHGNKAQAVEPAQRIIGGGEGDVVCAQADLMDTVVDGGLDGDPGGLAEGDGDHGLVEGNGLRGGDGDAALAHNLAVIDHLGGHSALGAVGDEHAIFDGAHALLLDGPLDIGRDLNLGADGIGAHGSKLHGAAGRVVIIVGLDGGTGKHAVRGSGGDDQNGVGGGALAAVGQGAVDLQFLAGTLGAEGGGAAAVAVRGDDAAHLNHVVSHLIAGKARGIGSLLTVGDSHHQGAVGLHAHEGSRSDAAAVILAVLVDGIAVGVGLDQEAEEHGDSLLLPAGQGIQRAADPDLGHIGGTGLAGQGMVVVIDHHDGLDTAVVLALHIAAVGVELTVQDGVAQGLTNQMGVLFIIRLGVPAQGAVGGGNHVAVAQLLGVQSLNRGGFGAVIALLGPHTLGAGDNLGIGVVQVHGDRVEDLSAGACLVVQNELSFRDTGCEIPVLLGNYLVISKLADVLVILDARGQHTSGDKARKHGNRKQHREKTGQCAFSHCSYSFFSFLYNRPMPNIFSCFTAGMP